jgi:UDPglucose 6-dehydrogenase
MKTKIAIIGHGFVGKAVEYGFTHPDVELHIVDPKYGTTVDNLPVCNYYFVCVPTPFGSDGTIDTTILDDVMEKLVAVNGIVIIKSTVTPDVITKWHNHIVYNPEFLTEKSANEQFVSPEFHIFGGFEVYTNEIERLYKEFSLCTPCPALHMSLEEASFVKYTINSFLAIKVTFFNQLYDTVKTTRANYGTIIKAVGFDKRIGPSHTKVPGFDKRQGYGGACFPKDTSAFVSYSKRLTLLEECIKINNTYRSQYELDEREKEQHVDYGQTKKEL